MSKRIVITNIRFNLEKSADRAAWEYLQQRNQHDYTRKHGLVCKLL